MYQAGKTGLNKTKRQTKQHVHKKSGMDCGKVA